MKKCTPCGYVLHGVAELVYYSGLIALPVVLGVLISQATSREFAWGMLWLLTVPPALVVTGLGVIKISGLLARRKGFQYDDASGEASWLESGRRVTFRYDSKPVPEEASAEERRAR